MSDFKYKNGDYIKRINNECCIPWLFAFVVGETVKVLESWKDKRYGYSVYLCENKYGIIWRLKDDEVELSNEIEYNKNLPEYTKEFIRDNLRLCGVLKDDTANASMLFEDKRLRKIYNLYQQQRQKDYPKQLHKNEPKQIPNRRTI